LRSEEVQGSGPGGRVLKEDVMAHAASRAQNGQQTPHKEGAPEPSPIDHPAPAQPDGKAPQEIKQPATPPQAASQSEIANPQSALEEVVPMSLLRRHVAQRLVEAQQTAALLTTFNEIDMSAVMQMRKEHQDAFQKKYNIKLGFMSFFVKAAIDALKQTPGVNAEIRGRDIVYKNHYDIGVAIGSGKGLVVPVLRNAERLSFAEVEQAITDFAVRVKDNKIVPDELQGGTFTITNGGIYGSLMSTPIVNPPQSGILGMHSIQERPVARNGEVVIRPMMYVALTYDHRVVDGREAVTFLVRIKECIENPARMLIEV
jgi:2-oxoglutarate dehydrogenase E2 component (dihydrolipoamide succinyltransferase)